MEGAGGDLQTKYHKIAGEYSKLRAQLVVLKKAVVEEQSLNVELKEALREKEQTLRKADQEADSLTFRNEQLTRRVTVLQDELDAVQNQPKNKKGKGKVVEGHQNSQFTNHVIDEEFRKKIAENAQLLSMVHEKDEIHNQEVNNLTSQIHKLQQELDTLKMSTADSIESYKNIISQLKEDLMTVKSGQENWGKMSNELSVLRRTHSEFEINTEKKLNSLNKIIKDHLPFVDSTIDNFNALNVNCAVDNQQNELSSNVLEYLKNNLQRMCTTLATWHSNSNHRLSSLSVKDSTVNIKYSKHLLEMKDLATDMFKCMAFTSEDDSEDTMKLTLLQKIPELFTSYSDHAETLLIHQRLSIEEEEEIEFTKSASKEINKELMAKSSQLIACFMQLSSWVNAATKCKTVQHALEYFQSMNQELMSVFVSIHEVFKGLFNVYASKTSIENEDNLKSEDFKRSNKEITECFSILMDTSSTVVECLQELSKSGDKLPTPHTIVTDLKRRATHYINSLQIDEAPSVSYLDALKDHEDAKNSAQMHEVLLQQLAECRELYVKSEQDKEHWQEEYEIVKLKLSQERKTSGKSTTLSESTETNMLGALSSPVKLDEEVEVREQELKKYFQDRIGQLIVEAHESESKATTHISENHALLRRLEMSIESNEKAEEALLEARESIRQLQEEVAITSSNYEAQLSTMSDHLANMNEKLAQQKEFIDHLEYQISNKNNKKGKK